MFHEPLSKSFGEQLVYHEDQPKLTAADVGKVFVRVYPRKVYGFRWDTDFIPRKPNVESCKFAERKLCKIEDGGDLVFKGVTVIKDWNDGHWMETSKYLDLAQRCIQLYPPK